MNEIKEYFVCFKNVTNTLTQKKLFMHFFLQFLGDSGPVPKGELLMIDETKIDFCNPKQYILFLKYFIKKNYFML
jgi:hypothetical protein